MRRRRRALSWSGSVSHRHSSSWYRDAIVERKKLNKKFFFLRLLVLGLGARGGRMGGGMGGGDEWVLQ